VLAKVKSIAGTSALYQWFAGCTGKKLTVHAGLPAGQGEEAQG